jgi:hypothetical protein
MRGGAGAGDDDVPEAACVTADRGWACGTGADGTTVRASTAAAEAATIPPPTPADASGTAKRRRACRPRPARSNWSAAVSARVPAGRRIRSSPPLPDTPP